VCDGVVPFSKIDTTGGQFAEVFVAALAADAAEVLSPMANFPPQF
jgi:hypothetical protein